MSFERKLLDMTLKQGLSIQMLFFVGLFKLFDARIKICPHLIYLINLHRNKLIYKVNNSSTMFIKFFLINLSYLNFQMRVKRQRIKHFDDQ